jgi:hypothetical protein
MVEALEEAISSHSDLGVTLQGLVVGAAKVGAAKVVDAAREGRSLVQGRRLLVQM